MMSEQSGRGGPRDRPPRDGRPGASQAGAGRGQPGGSGTDVFSDLQRWLIRSSAKNMRREFEDQVRRTIGGQRQEKSDVWDVATTEIPPEVGEAPECQWCPICRAARRMRESGQGVSTPLSGAGDAVAGAVQDAVKSLDGLLARLAGGSAAGDRPRQARNGAHQARTASSTGRRATPQPGTPQPGRGQTGTPQPGTTAPAPGAEPRGTDQGAASGARPDSLTGEHGPVGWKPGDRLATAGVANVDPWATATEHDETAEGSSDAGAGGPDGRGHGPGDRG